MRRMAVALTVLFCLIYGRFSEAADVKHQTIVIDTPDEYHSVEVSLTDMNRIVCDAEPGVVVFSKEKEVEVKQSGKNVFVKFLPIKKTTPEGKIEFEYSKNTRDMFVECGGRVFSLTLIPREIPSVTVLLKTPWTDIKKASSWEESRDYETLIIELVSSAYSEVPPDGYSIVSHTPERYNFREANVVCMKTYKGFRFEVRLCEIIAKTTVNLSEKEILKFLPKKLSPVALSIFEPYLKKGQKTRMVVVYKHKTDSRDGRDGGDNAR